MQRQSLNCLFHVVLCTFVTIGALVIILTAADTTIVLQFIVVIVLTVSLGLPVFTRLYYTPRLVYI